MLFSSAISTARIVSLWSTPMESALLVVRSMFDILEKLNDVECEHHDQAWYQELLIGTG